MMLSHSQKTETLIKPGIPLPELIEDIRDIDNFHRLFAKDRVLGEGADGMVCSYMHTTSNCVVAVKVPAENPKRDMNRALLGEIKKMELLGNHPNIVTILGAFASHIVSGPSRGPALFIPFFQLGDLVSYARSLRRQQIKNDMPQRVPEVTVWKFFKDLSLGLNFLHNENSIRFVHNDLKPDNILVALPNNWDLENGLPAEPTFQISDFGRLAQYPGTDRWSGTCEYAPPLSEQRGPVRPSADIWSLGATIQWFVLYLGKLLSLAGSGKVLIIQTYTTRMLGETSTGESYVLQSTAHLMLTRMSSGRSTTRGGSFRRVSSPTARH
jgi:serine/threonine protein kinase